MSNTAAVQAIYKAFGEGRVKDIVDQVTSDVIWIDPGTGAVPWAGTWLGPDRVTAFFSRLAETVNVEKFQPREFVESGDTVVALGYWEGRSKAADQPFASNWAMVWKFRDGKVCFYQSYMDTSEVAKAFPKATAKAH